VNPQVKGSWTHIHDLNRLLELRNNPSVKRKRIADNEAIIHVDGDDSKQWGIVR
jgi:hypothetical protein